MGANGSYPSRSKVVGTFKGARVDLANRIVHLHNAAVCNPSPAVIPTDEVWQGDYGYLTQPGVFVVYTADLTEYKFDLP